MQVYFRVATYTDELACRDELSRAILEQAERLGVELAVPTKSNHATASAAEPHPVPPPPKHLGRERPETSPHGQSLATDHEPRSQTQLIGGGSSASPGSGRSGMAIHRPY